MSKTIEVTVYQFSELSEVAKEQAKIQHSANFPYFWGDDALQSIMALAEHFSGSVRDYEIDWTGSSYSSMKFDMPEMEPEEIQERLESLGSYNPETLKGLGDCVLTGFCMDEAAIDGFRRAFHEGERDLSRLMQSAFTTWLKACQDDYNAFYEDSEFSEYSDINGYWYHADGSLA